MHFELNETRADDIILRYKPYVRTAFKYFSTCSNTDISDASYTHISQIKSPLSNMPFHIHVLLTVMITGDERQTVETILILSYSPELLFTHNTDE